MHKLFKKNQNQNQKLNIISKFSLQLGYLISKRFFCLIYSFGSSSQLEQEKSTLVTQEDLQHICRLVEENDGGPAWIQMMDRSTPTMSYRAWRRDPVVILNFL